ncbi:PPOX class F420-dependent oxidoreductase [Enemella dayhoffiae]|uniref:PPOX class F420-dependent oxidoreductase n=1 Tax=Enemella dayhoffiae TaxID=2016507 RepID=UPI001595B3AA|nr:PPOX class F420-dependent oxidoreductase [Enemella dayhoffiae]
MRIADEQFVLLTTFKKDGTPVATPVWIAALPDGRAAFTTSTSTWKTKRLRRDPRVTVQPCSRTGTPRPGSAEIVGTGQVVTAGPDLTAARRAIRKKYGIQVPIIFGVQAIISRFSNRFGRNDAAVLLTLP